MIYGILTLRTQLILCITIALFICVSNANGSSFKWNLILNPSDNTFSLEANKANVNWAVVAYDTNPSRFLELSNNCKVDTTTDNTSWLMQSYCRDSDKKHYSYGQRSYLYARTELLEKFSSKASTTCTDGKNQTGTVNGVYLCLNKTIAELDSIKILTQGITANPNEVTKILPTLGQLQDASKSTNKVNNPATLNISMRLLGKIIPCTSSTNNSVDCEINKSEHINVANKNAKFFLTYNSSSCIFTGKNSLNCGDEIIETSDVQCDYGYYKDGIQCKACPAGYYCEGRDIEEPTPCKEGTFNNTDMGRTESDCKPCSAGTFCDSDGNTTDGEACSANHYSAEGSFECASCPPGEKPNLEQSDCESCGAGIEACSRASDGSVEIISCEAAFYLNSTPTKSCVACSENQASCRACDQSIGDNCSSDSGGTSGGPVPITCSGTYIKQGNECVCPQGAACDTSGGSTTPALCNGTTPTCSCPDGQYKTTSYTCANCEPGDETCQAAGDGGGGSEPLKCKAAEGYVIYDNTCVCLAGGSCDTGSSSVPVCDGRATQCACPVGKGFDISTGGCSPCPTSPGAEYCKKPDGEGPVVITNCEHNAEQCDPYNGSVVACPAGQGYDSQTNQCEACPTGTSNKYCIVPDGSQPNTPVIIGDCPNNAATCDNSGAVESCPAGNGLDSSGACVACPTDIANSQYCNTIKVPATIEDCPSDRADGLTCIQDETGNVTVSCEPTDVIYDSASNPACTTCIAGYGYDASSNCAICPVGTASDATSNQCTPCQQGTYANSTQASSCQSCGEGVETCHAETGDAITCNDDYGLSGTSCAKCALNEFSPQGTSSCQSCGEGVLSCTTDTDGDGNSDVLKPMITKCQTEYGLDSTTGACKICPTPGSVDDYYCERSDYFDTNIITECTTAVCDSTGQPPSTFTPTNDGTITDDVLDDITNGTDSSGSIDTDNPWGPVDTDVKDDGIHLLWSDISSFILQGVYYKFGPQISTIPAIPDSQKLTKVDFYGAVQARVSPAMVTISQKLFDKTDQYNSVKATVSMSSLRIRIEEFIEEEDVSEFIYEDDLLAFINQVLVCMEGKPATAEAIRQFINGNSRCALDIREDLKQQAETARLALQASLAAFMDHGNCLINWEDRWQTEGTTSAGGNWSEYGDTETKSMRLGLGLSAGYGRYCISVNTDGSHEQSKRTSSNSSNEVDVKQFKGTAAVKVGLFRGEAKKNTAFLTDWYTIYSYGSYGRAKSITKDDPGNDLTRTEANAWQVAGGVGFQAEGNICGRYDINAGVYTGKSDSESRQDALTEPSEGDTKGGTYSFSLDCPLDKLPIYWNAKVRHDTDDKESATNYGVGIGYNITDDMRFEVNWEQSHVKDVKDKTVNANFVYDFLKN